MTDIHNPQTRSFNMSQIRGKDTKPEMIVRKFLHSNGYRYRLHNKDLTGKPDITLPKHSTIINVHGCFWHGHEGCKYFVIPKTRTEWWKNKIYSTKERDKENTEALREEGWNTITVWECELKSQEREDTLRQLIKKIEQN